MDNASPSSQHFTPQETLPEKTIWEGNPSHYYYLGHYIVGSLFLLLFLVSGVSVVLWFIFGSISIFWALLDKKSKVFTITNKRVKSKRGIFACTTQEVTIKDIRVINLKQSIIEKLCNLGTIEIELAGTSGIEVSFNGILQAPKIKNMITELKDRIT